MARRLILFILIASLPWHAEAANLCPTVAAQPQSEGRWPIPEKAFTRQTAERELRKLHSLLGPAGAAADAIVWENSFVMLEGWYLKRQALDAAKRGAPALFISDFCEFMKERAYVRH